jgi:hypothetical protein
MFLAEGSSMASGERVGKLREGGQQIDDAQSGHRAADVIVGQDVANGWQRLDKIVAIPEGGPWDEDQQQSCFEQEGDEQQTSEQGA